MSNKEIHSGNWKRGGGWGFSPCIVGMAFPARPANCAPRFSCDGCPEAHAFFVVVMKIEIQIAWDAVITQLRLQQVVLVAPAASGPAAIDWALPNPSVLRGLRY